MKTTAHPASLRRALVAVLALATLSTASSAARADDNEVVGMVWRHRISDRVEKSRIKKFGVGPQADGQSRLETELRAEIALSRLPEARAKMDALAASPAKASKLFGANHRVAKLSVRPRKVWDLYVDTPDGALDKTGAALRIRVENGTAQLNYKPPGGKFLPEGLKIGVENGITLNADPVTGKLPASVVEFFMNTRLQDNPLREIRKQFPGFKVEDFFFLQHETKQRRQIYEVQELEGSQWVKKSEISVDRVVSRDAHRKFTTVYGRVELEGDHVSAGALSASQLQRTSNRPHRAADAHNKSFNASKDVHQIRGYVSALTSFLGVKPVKESKYVHSRARLAAKGARFGRGKYMIAGIKRPRARVAPRGQLAASRVVKPKARGR